MATPGMQKQPDAKPRTALQIKQDDLKQKIDARQANLLQLLPSGIDKAAYWRKVIFAIFSDPKIAECDPTSIIESVNEAVQLGLDPTGILGEAYLIPLKGRCEIWIGFQGMISLARRSGQIKSIEVVAVFEGDYFECERGTESRLVHRPDWDGEYLDDPNRLQFVYAVAKLHGGGMQFDVMSRKAVERIRLNSPMGKRGPWVEHYVAMAQKTVIRRLFKMLPRSAEINRALEISAREDAQNAPLHMPDFETLRAIVPPSGTEQLKAAAQAAIETTATSAPAPTPERVPGADDDAEDIATKAEQEAQYRLAHPGQ